MRMAIRREVLKLALEDAETRRKLDLAPTWDDCVVILKEFAEKHGFKVVQI
jgi:hypothetical protein